MMQSAQALPLSDCLVGVIERLDAEGETAAAIEHAEDRRLRLTRCAGLH